MKPGIEIKKLLLISCLFITGCTKRELTEPGSDKSFDQSLGNKPSNNSNSWTINTIAGSSVYGYSGDGGPAINAVLNNPANVNADKKGNVYICDLNNNVVRKIDAETGLIHTVAGNGISGYSGDGGLATQASLNLAFHTVVDENGNLFISDLLNNRIRKVDKFTGIITTVAGTGVNGYNGDGNNALSTNLSIPMGIAFDNFGNLLISDETGLRIRKLNMKTGIITTIAGSSNRGFGGDGGPATQATFNFIWNITTDKEGNIFLNDESNYRIRKIDGRTGIITTFAGNGVLGNSGNGGLAKNASFTQPVGIAVDDNGNLFISDEVLSQIYRVDKQTGIINLIAGNGTNGFFGDGGPAINALLSHPNSLSIDKAGNIYVNDGNNNRIRKISNRLCGF